jgi:hypothetical protein
MSQPLLCYAYGHALAIKSDDYKADLTGAYVLAVVSKRNSRESSRHAGPG